jgi:hypothetical protein
MMARIADFLDDAIAQSQIEKQAIIRGFLEHISSDRSLRIATLNYDDAIERSVSEFWDGFTPANPGSLDHASSKPVMIWSSSICMAVSDLPQPIRASRRKDFQSLLDSSRARPQRLTGHARSSSMSLRRLAKRYFLVRCFLDCARLK